LAQGEGRPFIIRKIRIVVQKEGSGIRRPMGRKYLLKIKGSLILVAFAVFLSGS